MPLLINLLFQCYQIQCGNKTDELKPELKDWSEKNRYKIRCCTVSPFSNLVFNAFHPLKRCFCFLESQESQSTKQCREDQHFGSESWLVNEFYRTTIQPHVSALLGDKRTERSFQTCLKRLFTDCYFSRCLSPLLRWSWPAGTGCTQVWWATLGFPPRCAGPSTEGRDSPLWIAVKVKTSPWSPGLICKYACLCLRTHRQWVVHLHYTST